MNWLDILIIISLAASIISGLAAGFARGALTLVGLITGIVVAGRLYDNLAVRLSSIPHEGAANIAAFAIIFFAIMLLAAIIIQILRMVIIRGALSLLDRLLGGLAGLLIGIIAWGLLLALWAKFFGGATLESSLLAPFLAAKLPLALSLLPSEFENVKEFFR